MDMALQVFQLDANMTKTVDNRKTFTTSKGNEFNKLLGKIKELTGKRKENEVHPLLMQLMNILNIDTSWLGFEELLEQQHTSSFTNLENILYDKLPTDELNRCWQAILAEFNITGDVKLDTIEKFHSALLKALPHDADLEPNILRDAISDILRASNLKPKTNSFNSKLSNNNLVEHSMNEVTNLEDKNVKGEELEADLLRDESELSIRDELNHDKRVFVEDNFGSYEKSDEHTQQEIGPDSQQQDIFLASHTQKSTAASTGKAITISTSSSESPDVFDQLIDKVRFALKGEVQEIKVRLKPEYLGDVMIKVISEKGKLKAELFVGNTHVRSMLKAHAIEFQNQIREQGYNFSEINVYKMDEGFEMGTFDHRSGGNNSYQGKKSKGNSYFEVTESQQSTVTDNYGLWGYISNINYMA
ncbi:MAG: flagellar hook-length control protein FliK [Tepidanaerobacter sp.]|nr:flagellar hook-length control protein FliK [Tepidanaerobacter sp.]